MTQNDGDAVIWPKNNQQRLKTLMTCVMVIMKSESTHVVAFQQLGQPAVL